MLTLVYLCLSCKRHQSVCKAVSSCSLKAYPRQQVADLTEGETLDNRQYNVVLQLWTQRSKMIACKRTCTKWMFLQLCVLSLE